MRKCRRCHAVKEGQEFALKSGGYRGLCSICFREDTLAKQKARDLARKRERYAIDREVAHTLDKKRRREDAKKRAPMKALEKVIALINQHLAFADIPPMDMPPCETLKKVRAHLLNLRKIRQQFFMLTSVNRNQLLRMSKVTNARGGLTDARTTKAIQERQRIQEIASEALKTALDEYLRGESWNDVDQHYKDLLLILR